MCVHVDIRKTLVQWTGKEADVKKSRVIRMRYSR